jgi:hypothetical protein
MMPMIMAMPPTIITRFLVFMGGGVHASRRVTSIPQVAAMLMRSSPLTHTCGAGEPCSTEPVSTTVVSIVTTVQAPSGASSTMPNSGTIGALLPVPTHSIGSASARVMVTTRPFSCTRSAPDSIVSATSRRLNGW